MRLDKYLKFRGSSSAAPWQTRCRCGPHPHQWQDRQASQAVKEGDIIEVTFGNRPIKVKVLSDVEPRTKDVAREMYEIISE